MSTVRTALLVSGILASLDYVAANVVAGLSWNGYSFTDQTISELSAIGAPSRPTWLAFAIAYDVLSLAFAIGVWQSSRGRRGLRIAAGLLLAMCVLNPFWPPMHLRGTPPTLTDTLHVAFAGVTSLMFLLVIGFAANAFGKRFRFYSIATLAALVLFGVATFSLAGGVATDAPTPWLGVYERLDLGVYLAWTVVLAIALLREARPRAQSSIAW